MFVVSQDLLTSPAIDVSPHVLPSRSQSRASQCYLLSRTSLERCIKYWNAIAISALTVEIREHWESTHPSRTASHRCEACNVHFTLEKDLNRHLRTSRAHTNSKTCLCACGKAYFRRSELLRHINKAKETLPNDDHSHVEGIH